MRSCLLFMPAILMSFSGLEDEISQALHAFIIDIIIFDEIYDT